MKTERNILIAFILNLSFSIFEFIGGFLTGSAAILSDAVHDIGDAASIGLSFYLEKKSKKQPDENYTYGYARYSVVGGCITTLILLIGSVLVICNAVHRALNPIKINFDGMIIFAALGVCINLCAAFFTREGGSVNQKAVNLHMLEDVLGWVVVLVGAIVMRFTGFALVDPIMSIGVAAFILANAIRNLKGAVDIFLEKVPCGACVTDVIEQVEKIDGVLGVHHIHLWSLDGHNSFATLHVVTDEDAYEIKGLIRDKLRRHGIGHITIETERSYEQCRENFCHTEPIYNSAHRHHHGHHHSH